ncbi:hypothetical protein [Arthrobacter bambusae]|uniref:CRISPR/Cas system-associated exonuclease Cas4 (RecB family) n=1 Tax=Arthrobacter bambusae TaxID=1338426 RepID=A0AAW8DD68_9MICC|nr:hypothetical protein [Arthrobacter bambusae]MDP9903235.1 CRISPR/Cas system-associated exonuclease Cas4 (RecB family) [Arthrobacter bambusae]MDQ0128771.1 CRISPR/Cas system-associated exonuclease Cas4 (RecB family) [Arthrobacter bambusae]MDQ0180112.1 CRISPR/Cas system-associated exonuclease Cas4 (RecB family) [Arthrobacter bambusae]
MPTQNTAQTVVFLEALASIVENSPETYSADAAKELSESILSMAEVVTTDFRIDPSLLDLTRQYAAADWHNELAAVLLAKEHRAKVH